jgi:hypothetical protein
MMPDPGKEVQPFLRLGTDRNCAANCGTRSLLP